MSLRALCSHALADLHQVDEQTFAAHARVEELLDEPIPSVSDLLGVISGAADADRRAEARAERQAFFASVRAA